MKPSSITLFVLPAIALGLSAISTVSAQQAAVSHTPAPSGSLTVPQPPQAPGHLVYVPWQGYSINSVTGRPQFPPEMQARIDKGRRSCQIAVKADGEAAQGDWANASVDYQQALALLPGNQIALYGLGDHAQAEGDTQAAIEYYRQAIYDYADAKPPALPPFGESNAFRVMEYAILLSQAGQAEEAVRVYNRGAYLSNYMGGQPRPRLPLPEFGTETGQLAYTPQRLQALANVGWAADHVDFDREGAKARMGQAVKLFPDSPVPYFFRARYAIRLGRDRQATAADYDKAEQLGGGAADEMVERDRTMFHLPPAMKAVQKP